MGIPTHGPLCMTRMYRVNCWYCGSRIYVLECSCGSAVLFNYNKPPWDEHTCSGGIGDSGLSGWNAIEALQNAGMPLSKEMMDTAFGRKAKQAINRPDDLSAITQKVEPRKGDIFEPILNLEGFYKNTKETKNANALLDIGRGIEGIPKNEKNFCQITFIRNHEDGRESYTALIASNKVPANIEKEKEHRSIFFVRLLGLKSWWLVDSIVKL